MYRKVFAPESHSKISDVLFTKEVSGVCTSPFSDTDELKMALLARNVSGALEKLALVCWPMNRLRLEEPKRTWLRVEKPRGELGGSSGVLFLMHRFLFARSSTNLFRGCYLINVVISCLKIICHFEMAEKDNLIILLLLNRFCRSFQVVIQWKLTHYDRTSATWQQLKTCKQGSLAKLNEAGFSASRLHVIQRTCTQYKELFSKRFDTI